MEGSTRIPPVCPISRPASFARRFSGRTPTVTRTMSAVMSPAVSVETTMRSPFFENLVAVHPNLQITPFLSSSSLDHGGHLIVEHIHYLIEHLYDE